MKVKTALEQSKSHAKLLGVVVVVLLAWLVLAPGTAIGIITALASVAWAMEVINILYISRKARANPDYLEEKIQ
jgi:hypothetical protein